MSRPRFFNVVSLCSIFHFSLIFIVITSLKPTHLAFVQFLKYLLLFFDDNVDEQSEYIFISNPFFQLSLSVIW